MLSPRYGPRLPGRQDGARPIRILGAGPAGLSAAIALADRQREVVVYERHPRCGDRFGGDLQGIENWSSDGDTLRELSDFGIEVNFDCHPFSFVRGVSFDHQVFDLGAREPLYYLVKRGPFAGSLDDGLRRQAIERGVQIEFDQRVDERDVDIVATGPKSRDVFAVDKGIVFETDMPDEALVIFDNRVAYHGYSYLLVSQGYGCMCTVLFGQFPQIHEQFERTKETYDELVQLTIRNPRPVGGVGTFSHTPRFVREGRLYVGEAAGLQDLLWGFGIRFAIRSGNLAARCLLDGEDYEKRARQAFRSSLRVGVVNRFLWETIGNRGYKGFLQLGFRSSDRRRYLKNAFQFDLKRRALFPFALWGLRRRHPKLKY